MIKVNVVFSAEFILPHTGTVEIKTFNTRNEVISNITNLDDWYKKYILEKILRKLEEFQERDLGWALSKILHLKVHINKYEPISGSSYIDLPADIKLKKAVVNVKNDDNFCFLWAVVSALHPVHWSENANRTSSYPHYSKVLKYDGLSFPLQLKDIPKFEDVNNLSINVYTLQKVGKRKHEVVPLALSEKKIEKCIHLLMITEAEEEEEAPIDVNDDDDEMKDLRVNVNNHYMWIKNLSRLLRKQLSKHKSKNWLCDRCLNHFITEKTLNKHYQMCKLKNK